MGDKDIEGDERRGNMRPRRTRGKRKRGLISNLGIGDLDFRSEHPEYETQLPVLIVKKEKKIKFSSIAYAFFGLVGIFIILSK